MNTRIIKLSDYTFNPGGRLKSHGKFSGEWFRDDILMPNIIDAEIKHEKIIINLDDVYSLPKTFLREVFYGLITKYKYKNFKDLTIVCHDDLGITADIYSYIAEAEIITFGKHLLN